MDVTEINTIIATFCGWTQIENTNSMAMGGIWRGYPPTMAIVGQKEYLPHYHCDLNRMHEAEQMLPDEQTKRIYVDYLVGLMKPGEFTVMAPAHHRANALIQTIQYMARSRCYDE